MPNLAGPVQTPLDVSRPPTREISHRQRKKFPAQKIENCGVETDRGKGEQVFLRKGGELDENERCEHAQQNHFQQADVIFDDDFINDDLGKYGEEEREKTDGDREP